MSAAQDALTLITQELQATAFKQQRAWMNVALQANRRGKPSIAYAEKNAERTRIVAG